MRLYLIKVQDESKLTWSRYIGFVVLAGSGPSARKVILEMLRGLGYDDDHDNLQWFSDPKQTPALCIGNASKGMGTEARILLESNTGD